MKKPNQFSVFDCTLQPRMIIEASAGTGKTYSITGLLVRLLLERNISIEKILVVTFTRLATKELKDRVMLRLWDSLKALESGEAGDDPFMTGLLEFVVERNDAAARIRKAIRNFDDARIVTIHGFCQQVLQEEVLASGVLPEMELNPSDDLLVEAAEDYWRDFIHRHSSSEAGRYLISKVLQIADNPAELLRQLRPLLVSVDVEIEATISDDPIPKLQQILDLRKKLASIWIAEREEILKQIDESDIKSGSRYLQSRSEKMEMFLADETYRDDTFEQFRHFCSSTFRQNLKKNGSRLPEHTFFDTCEIYAGLIDGVADVMTWFLHTSADSIGRLEEEKRTGSSSITYDHLLTYLNQALLAPNSGKALAARLRKSFPYALVDEFQDTDPVQYSIFREIYPEKDSTSVLVMIGDPKQAIYAFRGADLYAYLRARRDVDDSARYTLLQNFRSTPRLIQAVNCLFKPVHQSPFLEDQIDYHEIEAGNYVSDLDYTFMGKPPVPLKICFRRETGSKEELKRSIYGETAYQVKELILQGLENRTELNSLAEGGARGIQGSDIAILVQTHRDAETIKTLLKDLGVDSVTYSREDVFSSREAERVEQLLTAILDPGNRSKLNVALTTGFFGNHLASIYELQNSDREMEDLSAGLRDLNELWHRYGCYTPLRRLLFEFHALEHLSELQDSDRVITNLQQIVELAAFEEMENELDPPALLQWFRRKMADDSTGREEEALRLESDEDLVTISTIHNSKGLEFPVVFCPALWLAKDQQKRDRLIETYHRKTETSNQVINLEQKETATRIEARKRARFEEVSEEVRKTYVAVTRAKYECRILWGTARSSNLSGLGALLLGPDEIEASIEKKLEAGRGVPLTAFSGPLMQLAKDHPEWISFTEINESPREIAPLPGERHQAQMTARNYRGPLFLTPRKSIYSFSSLLHARSGGGTHEPDYDQLETYAETRIGRNRSAGPADIFHFPRGKSAGTCIHKLFEHSEFDFRNPARYAVIAEETCGMYGFDGKWSPALCRMMETVATADYGELKLSQTPPDEMLKEMDFHFPAAETSTDRIRAVIRNGDDLSQSDTSPTGERGYMTGFIDLIVRRNGLYYILDYKSNHLGSTAEEYSEEILGEEMTRAGYDIQYHLYVLALKKYLEKRDPAFSYDTGFGGVYYLFVRGMKPGERSGIFFDHPPAGRINKLEEILRRDHGSE